MSQRFTPVIIIDGCERTIRPSIVRKAAAIKFIMNYISSIQKHGINTQHWVPCLKVSAPNALLADNMSSVLAYIRVPNCSTERAPSIDAFSPRKRQNVKS